MAKKSLEEIINQNIQLGFDRSIIEIAFANVNGEEDHIIDEILRLQQNSSNYPTKPSNPQDQDAQLSKAIQMSMNEAKDKKICLQPLNPEQRVRKSGIPIGLKNIGNTCYFNSLLQTYFQNMNFVQQILNYEIPEIYRIQNENKKKQKKQQQQLQQEFEFKRKIASCNLVNNLKELFAMMIASDRKYIDPTDVIGSIVDDYGNQLPIGDQKDIGQFNLIFLSRIDQGLNEGKLAKHMQIQQNTQKSNITESKIIDSYKQKQQSLLQRSTIKLSSKSIISQNFIGKFSTSFHNQSCNIHKPQEELFSLLFINVKNKQLYQACQQLIISQINDYRNQKGQIITVQKHSWIKQAPKTIFFQIDRVHYDKQKCVLIKINDIFDFPKTFYVDPFLQKNKQSSIKIQQKIKSLRMNRSKYLKALENIQNYGNKNFNLSDLLTQTAIFLQQQNQQMEVQDELNNSTYFPKLKNQIKNQYVDLLKQYRNSTNDRIKQYHSKVNQIDNSIEKQYQQIRSSPYYLYSILVHQGGADSGHYYSYQWDIGSNVWRKYNDINITQEIEQQVLRQAKGYIHGCSAYYLVYAQKNVLMNQLIQQPIHTYKLCHEEGYMKDYYSSFLDQKMRQKLVNDNQKMYMQIEKFKMGSFVSKVIDSYVRKFENWNEIFRKSKPEKKKNTPPLLINFPLFVKYTVNQQEYKASIIQNCLAQYGPKQINELFYDLLKKKSQNFNQFKRPMKYKAEQKYVRLFQNSIILSKAAKKLFQCLLQSKYSGIFIIFYELQKNQVVQYFHWLCSLITKVTIVQLLIQCQNDSNMNPIQLLKKLKIVLILLFKFIKEEEKSLLNNCYFWINQIMISIQDQNIKKQIQQICNCIETKKYNNKYDELIEKDKIQNKQNSINWFEIDMKDAMYNFSRQENTFINSMLQSRQNAKIKIQVANQLYRQMKKYNLPLKKQQRLKIIKSKL